jgi:uncharacterized membrane protein YeaQ/YmgE (transglycosylase-associated protein family)
MRNSASHQAKPSGEEVDNVSFLTWALVGLFAGWLAGRVMKGPGYGIIVDILLGIFAGILVRWIIGALAISHGGGMIGSFIFVFVGAMILVGITRLLKRT